jgi:dihydropteroate synthase
MVKVMGIVNCTPDSFYGNSRKMTVQAALDTVLRMEREGADMVDIGGESTRPGSRYVSLQEEMDRVLPVIEAVRGETDISLSVDTRKCGVAREAVKLGAGMINDISALEDDPDMAVFLAETKIPVVLMHKKGVPETMQDRPEYRDPAAEVLDYLKSRVRFALDSGIGKEKIILDPGIGFGKRLEDNIALIRAVGTFRQTGYPVLIGISRKSFIGSILGAEPEDRLAGSLAANAYAALQGADILRVHDVRETADMVRVFKELAWKT